LKPLTVQPHGVQDKDLSPHLLSIKSAGADGILMFDTSGSAALIMKQRKQLGMKDITLIGNGTAGDAPTLDLVTKDESEGVYVLVSGLNIGSREPRIVDYMRRYKEKYGKDADSNSTIYYDGVFILKKAIESVELKGDLTADREAIRRAIRNIQNYNGLTNIYSFRDDGESCSGLTAMQIRDKKVTPITEVSGILEK
jgi:branched-chain amino acid transport system substrate-binding protein